MSGLINDRRGVYYTPADVCFMTRRLQANTIRPYEPKQN